MSALEGGLPSPAGILVVDAGAVPGTTERTAMKVRFQAWGCPTGRPERDTTAEYVEPSPITEMFTLSNSPVGSVICMADGNHRRMWTLLEVGNG